ncbi:MAG: hypothetical protein NTZ27_07280 [Ignavibacteriales bacterium]|nr:hypothetical protein [Ignavibacteriales bacterium]
MKRFKSLLILAALLTLPLIYFTACSNKSEVNGPNQINFDSPQYAVIDYTDLMNGVEDATLNNDMTYDNSLYSYGFLSMSSFVQGNASGMMNGGMMSVNGGGTNWIMKFDFGKHLGLFFRRLNLSDQQKSDLKALMVKFHDDMKPLVQQFRDANADIIKAANEARKLIVEDLRAGKITRQEAAAKLKVLNDDTRQKINDNAASQTIKASMCALRATLFTDIASKLTGDQVTKWTDFSSKFPNPC